LSIAAWVSRQYSAGDILSSSAMATGVRVPSDSSHKRTRAREQGMNKRAELYTVFFTVGKFLAAKLCNSAQAAAKAE
jgi:hypothetical protein